MNISDEHELRLKELRKEIQCGIDSGEPTPLDIEAIKARGRERLAARDSGNPWLPEF
jgi:antitoxin ParD1/3/4